MKIDFANVSTTNFQANRVYAKGGWGAPNRVGFDGERTGTLQIDTQIMPVKLFALLSGKEIAKTATVLKREELTAGADASSCLRPRRPALSRSLLLAMTAALRSPIPMLPRRRLLLPALPRKELHCLLLPGQGQGCPER